MKPNYSLLKKKGVEYMKLKFLKIDHIKPSKDQHRISSQS